MLPCTTCKSECCGTIPVRKGELARIIKAVATWSDDEIARMESQEREPLMCPLVDTERWQCSVYEVRPTICRLYGLTPGLECPHAPAKARRMSREQAAFLLGRDGDLGDMVGILGLDIGWREIRHAAGRS